MPSDLTQVFQQYTDAWNSHDAAAIIATFEAGGTYNDPVTPGPLTGEAIGVYAKGLWDAFPDLSFETLSSIENGNGLLAAQWLMKGTNTGSMNGLPPTGKSISLRGADFVSVKGGKIHSIEGYFDGGAVPRSLGLDVIVQPSAIGPFEFGVSMRVSSGSNALPGAFSLTNIEARDEKEKATILEHGRKISQDMLSMPGFISLVTAAVGNRLMTVAAWKNQESMVPLMKGGAHRVAVDRYFRSELGRAGMTGIWVPGRLNPRRVRCEACSKMAPVVDSQEVCSCGATLPDPIVYW